MGNSAAPLGQILVENRFRWLTPPANFWRPFGPAIRQLFQGADPTLPQLFVLPVQKLPALGDGEDGDGEAVVGLGQVGAHGVEQGLVGEDDRAAEGVADEFAAEVGE